jgi:hypothetical protein
MAISAAKQALANSEAALKEGRALLAMIHSVP